MKKLFQNFTFNIKDDVFSGLTVALALVPEAVAFAFVAGIDPLVALYGAFIMGLITSLFGGRPGMISGATGAMAVVMVNMIQQGNEVGLAMAEPINNLGTQWLFITLLIVGVLQVSSGLFKLGKFVRLIPHSVMMGFVNGLAIVIFRSQFGMMPDIAPEGVTIMSDTGAWFQAFFSNAEVWTMLGLIGLTMGIMYFLPMLTKKAPSALVAIIVVAAITIFGSIDVGTVGSFIVEGGGSGLEGSLPTLQLDLGDYFSTITGHWGLIFSTAFLLAAVGLIESLMTLNLVDEITETRGSGNIECIAQGSANILSGLFGGMGGCAMIGQSIINVNSGGRGRLSGLVAALALLGFVLFGADLIEQIPLAALIGVMFMVVIGTFAWSSFRIINKIPRADAFVLIVVSAITVWQDLAIAVIAGVIISALVFAWRNATMIRARKSIKDNGTKVYEIWGPLFFGSVQTFTSKFDVREDPDKVEIDFIESRVTDHSGIEAVRSVCEKYLSMGKDVKLVHLSPECRELLLNADTIFEEIIQASKDDPNYKVVTNSMDDEI
ncbi:MAG: SulP family inorganic anion transporter [Flavobacteriales bacterium]|nr:SulP family inorganic anion transporter [Flavobacteriales bacterium]